jgi:hypothetical protein
MKTKLTRTRLQKDQETTLSKVNQIITSNKHLFRQGVQFTADDLVAMMSPIVPQLARNYPPHIAAMHKLTAYTKLNKVLAFRGLRVKSCNYGEYYEVATLSKAKKAVTTYTKVSRAKAKTSRLLNEGIERYQGKWRKLGKQQLQLLLTRI